MKLTRNFFVCLFIISLLLQGCAANSNPPAADNSQEGSSVLSSAGPLSGENISTRIMKRGDMPKLDLTLPKGEPVGEVSGEALGKVSQTPSSSLIKNDGTYFYYFDQLTSDEQQLYETLYSVLSYPDDTSWSVTAYLRCDPASSDFDQLWARSYTAMIYDHPELFWYWHRQSCGNMHWSYSSTPDSEGRYRATFNLNSPYTRYQTEMTAFNRATENFLNSIDLSQSDACIAMQIHDGLMELCRYNNDLYENPEYYSYGYSAYGALVDDGDGRDNCCVCAGYALAYEYLLQQVGIPCIYVRGDSGPDYSSMDSHAWNLVYLDGDWYEVDVTWDDIDPEDKEVLSQWSAGRKMLDDDEFMKKATHYLFCVTTDYISNFTDSDSYLYEDSESWVTTCDDSVRTRYDTTEDPVVYLAPEAYGTAYRQGKNCDRVVASLTGSSSSRLYDDGLVFPDSNKRYLTDRDLQELKNDSFHSMSMLLRMACNELYARRGYRFGTKWFADFYNQYSWYNGGTDGDASSVEDHFNEYERANKKFLHDYEKEHGWSWSPYE